MNEELTAEQIAEIQAAIPEGLEEISEKVREWYKNNG